MALIKVESAEVIRHVGQSAFAIQETINLPDGRSFPKSWTVWANDGRPEVGSLVTVTGEFSAKTRSYPAPSGMKTAIDLSINNPEVTVLHSKKVEDEGAPF